MSTRLRVATVVLGLTLLLSLSAFERQGTLPSAAIQPSAAPVLTATATTTPTASPSPTPTATPLYNCATTAQMPAAECQALVALYARTHGDDWLVKTGWLTGASPCDWQGVDCGAGALAGRVVVLSLGANNLSQCGLARQ